MNLKTVATSQLMALIMLSFTACADNNEQGLSGGTIPSSLIEFEVKGDTAAKNFTVLDKTQEGQWTGIILKRQSVHGNEKFIQLKIDCSGPNFIIVREYAPTLDAMQAQPASTLEQPQSIDVFWGELAKTVCASK